MTHTVDNGHDPEVQVLAPKSEMRYLMTAGQDISCMPYLEQLTCFEMNIQHICLPHHMEVHTDMHGKELRVNLANTGHSPRSLSLPLSLTQYLSLLMPMLLSLLTAKTERSWTCSQLTCDLLHTLHSPCWPNGIDVNILPGLLVAEPTNTLQHFSLAFYVLSIFSYLVSKSPLPGPPGFSWINHPPSLTSVSFTFRLLTLTHYR